MSFGEVIEASGHIPLPPYITREDEKRIQSVTRQYIRKLKGQLQLPTAGLHFTKDVLKTLTEKGVKRAEITLHVGAGTFQPVRADDASEHEMHCEHFFVTNDTIDELIDYHGRIVAVGTTSVRST